MTATATLAPPLVQSDWFATWFDSPHCHRLYAHLSRWSDRDAFFKRITIDAGPNDRPIEHVDRVAKLTLDDFRRIATLCGLRVEDTFGDYELGH